MSRLKTMPVKSWQFFHACKKNLGTESLTKLFQVSLRQVNRWSSDPDFAESNQRNPMDRYEKLLGKLMERGAEDIARAAVDRQANLVGCSLVTTEAVPDKNTIQEELLDNLPPLVEYQEAVLSGQPLEIIRGLARKAIDEIEQDMALINSEKNRCQGCTKQ